jgi:hypothetical protein
MAPLRIVGMALHSAAQNVIRIASVVDKPVVKTELAIDHPLTVTRSENQYHVKAHPDWKAERSHVSCGAVRNHELLSYPCPLVRWHWILICLLSTFVLDNGRAEDTIPAFAQTYSGAILEACFGRAQLDGSRKRLLALLKEASTRSPRNVVYVLRDFMMVLSEMGHSTSWDQRDGF